MSDSKVLGYYKARFADFKLERVRADFRSEMARGKPLHLVRASFTSQGVKYELSCVVEGGDYYKATQFVLDGLRYQMNMPST